MESPAVVAPATNSIREQEILSSDTLAPEEALPPAPAPEKKIETVRLGKGETLRILAERLFGNREFWVYIYLENKHIIPDPNRVPAGISLLVPDTRQYGIDAADPASVQSAKQQGDSLFQS
ncbi:hypothetical protein JS578_03610 [Dysgonomonadaceae bacterium zrk40]|nr:hypothetical protein JS578_03610 [Dysgonomonadaceae bacterium zrk40]